MLNLITQCVKRNETQLFVKEFLTSHPQFDYLPTHGYDRIFDTYKVYSKRDVRILYELKKFIQERNIASDAELLSALEEAGLSHGKYKNYISSFVSNFNESFVNSLMNSLYETAKKIQLKKLKPWQQSCLLELDPFFQASEIHVSCNKFLKN